MLKTRAGNHGRGLWASRTGAAALALGAAAAWMSACGDDPPGIAGGGEPASVTVRLTLAEPVAVGDERVLAAVSGGVSGTVQFSVADPA